VLFTDGADEEILLLRTRAAKGEPESVAVKSLFLQFPQKKEAAGGACACSMERGRGADYDVTVDGDDARRGAVFHHGGGSTAGGMERRSPAPG